MSLQRRDIEILRGETFQQDFIWQDEDGVRVDLSGFTLSSSIKAFPWSDDAITATEGSGHIVITNAAQGEYRLDISAAETESTLVGTVYQYSIEALEPDGTETAIFAGRLLMRPASFGTPRETSATMTRTPNSYVPLTVATLANDFAITENDAPFLIVGRSATTAPASVASGETATFAKFGTLTGSNRDGTTATITIYEASGPDGSYMLRGAL